MFVSLDVYFKLLKAQDSPALLCIAEESTPTGSQAVEGELYSWEP